MIKEDCLYYEKCNDMGATIHWCQNYPHLNFDCEKCERYIEKNFVKVVWCKDCKFWHTEGQYCDRLSVLWKEFYTSPNDYCSHGERKEDEIN